MGQNQPFPNRTGTNPDSPRNFHQIKEFRCNLCWGPRVHQKVIWEPEIFSGPREINKLGLLGYGPVRFLCSNVQ